uniref:Olduvai domain-containing protein n=1 Tax=Seriola dumerili TaxID=41447 RepID=A0A3B4VGS6_SERDU
EGQGLMEVKQLVEQKRAVERELGELKAQLEKAGFSSLSQMSKFDTLIQAQARELSHLRQRLREGRGVCNILTQHLGDTTKAFEELLRANDIDYYMGQSFRDQLAQSSALAQRVSAKISGRESHHVTPSVCPSIHHLIPQYPVLSQLSQHAMPQLATQTCRHAESDRTVISNSRFSTVFLSVGSDLMKEHLREVRSLRQRLEDSIQTNDRLRQQLEDRLARTATEKGNNTLQNTALPPLTPESCTFSWSSS